MFDPFVASDPPVLVHEIDGRDFDEAWKDFQAEGDRFVCPVCGQGRQRDRATSPHTKREWIRYSCGDVVAAEVTAG
jgi:hypothetical protein